MTDSNQTERQPEHPSQAEGERETGAEPGATRE